ncbi:hypothetical protein HK102_000947 [Quaeritorhiza haematococci]|nr:hypothetical protein HK102_000947 [Quaeritorhiza haematococci]
MSLNTQTAVNTDVTHPAPATEAPPSKSTSRSLSSRLLEITLKYAPLSVTTFGGPQAHIALLHNLFVDKLEWVSAGMFAELFAISSALPGPASTKVAYSIALIRAGVVPAIYSFFLWSFPGAIVMTLFALGVAALGGSNLPTWLMYIENGLTSSAVGLVALAAYKLGTKIITDNMGMGVALISASLTITVTGQAWLFPTLMVFGGVVAYVADVIVGPRLRRRRSGAKGADDSGLVIDGKDNKEEQGAKDLDAVVVEEAPTLASRGSDIQMRHRASTILLDQEDSDNSAALRNQGTHVEIGDIGSTSPPISRKNDAAPANVRPDNEPSDPEIYFSYTNRTGVLLLLLWVLLLVVAILLRTLTDSRPLNILGTFYFTGSIIFGGGPVVVPLLDSYVVTPGWMTNSEFLIGLAIINSLPGPNFNFAAYCGALALRGSPFAMIGALLAWAGIFFPGLLLKTAVLPHWKQYRSLPLTQTIFRGVNAAAVGLVFAAVYLLWEKAISGKGSGPGSASVGRYPLYVVITSFTFVVVGFMKVPAPVAIGVGGLVGIFEWLAVR